MGASRTISRERIHPSRATSTDVAVPGDMPWSGSSKRPSGTRRPQVSETHPCERLVEIEHVGATHPPLEAVVDGYARDFASKTGECTFGNREVLRAEVPVEVPREIVE